MAEQIATRYCRQLWRQPNWRIRQLTIGLCKLMDSMIYLFTFGKYEGEIESIFIWGDMEDMEKAVGYKESFKVLYKFLRYLVHISFSS